MQHCHKKDTSHKFREIERIVIEQIRSLLRTPEVIIRTWRAARKTDKGLAESEVRGALFEFEPLWNELFPAEQARIVELLVERVDLQSGGIDLLLRVEGLTSLCSELRSSGGSRQEAAWPAPQPSPPVDSAVRP